MPAIQTMGSETFIRCLVRPLAASAFFIGAFTHFANAQESRRELAKRLDAVEARVEKLEGGAAGVDAISPGSADAEAEFEIKLFSLPEGFQRRQLFSTIEKIDVDLDTNDTDLDGLTNAEETQLGTNPAVADTDGDALRDGWEVHGVNGIDLRALGASPLHKDVFVEMDFMTRATATKGLGPNASVLQRIRASFSQAQVSNPDGQTGINIHLELGNQVTYDDELFPYNTEFFALKQANFVSARAPVFRYMIWANGYRLGATTTSSGIAMGIPHSDFVVTLGRWNSNTGGTDDDKVGTFIHELGHTLGLTHGGAGDHTHYKPNHLSVMNYSFQNRGILVGSQRLWDYQRFSLPVLREHALSESTGLGGGPELSGYHTIIRPNREVPATSAIDWDGDGIISLVPVTADLNGDASLDDLQTTPNQWTSLVYNGGSIGTTITLDAALDLAEDAFEPFPYIELTEEMNRELAP